MKNEKTKKKILLVPLKRNKKFVLIFWEIDKNVNFNQLCGSNWISGGKSKCLKIQKLIWKNEKDLKIREELEKLIDMIEYIMILKNQRPWICEGIICR